MNKESGGTIQMEEIWERAKIVNGHDPYRYRKDDSGNWIVKEKFGNDSSCFGWKVCKEKNRPKQIQKQNNIKAIKGDS